MKEVWKATVLEGYEVSNLGNVRSVDRNIYYKDGRVRYQEGKLLSKCFDGKRYHVVNMKGTKKVHRLVAKAFIPNPRNLAQINHINGDKTDNRVENLEWISNSDNRKHAISSGIYPSEKLPKRVLALKDGKIFKEFESLNQAGKWLISKGEAKGKSSQVGCAISRACRRYRTTQNKTSVKAYGFSWEFV